MKMIKLIIFLSVLSVICAKQHIKIAGIFHESNNESVIAFRYSIERINVHEQNFFFEPIIERVSTLDSFKTEKIVCNLASQGVGAIFGPSSINTAGIVESVCQHLEIPHLIYHWSAEPLGGYRHQERKVMTLNVYPDNEKLSEALAALIVDYSWKSFTIIYETDESLMRLKDVLQIHNPDDSPITVRQIGADPDYRPLLKEIEKSGETHIVLDIHVDKIIPLLMQAQEVKLLEEYQSYIITSLDTHTLDFEVIKSGRSNITSVRMMDPNSTSVKQAVHDWEQGERRSNPTFRLSPEHLTTESVLIHDAVNLYAAAVRQLDQSGEFEVSELSCAKPSTWKHGFDIINFMHLQKIDGITGTIAFNGQGRRDHFVLEIIELYQAGFRKIGTWDNVNSVTYSRTSQEALDQTVQSLQNKIFKVASRKGPPFLIEKKAKDGDPAFEGNQRYEGYSVDLIEGISQILGFKYELELVKDNKYGSYNKETKTWDGLVKHLLDRKADLAVCDLTITYERRTAVDFTMPFMTLGVSILFAKPVKQPPDFFSFLSPLSLDVWIYMGTAYLGVSVLLFVLARMAPDDWENPHPCNQDPEEVENIWNMLNCTWLTMGSIMGQGCDILPKAVSTRLVCGMWWFFALIMLSSYTANLAAFLTMERMDASIESAEDLAKQSKIKYGAVAGGSTLSFFKESNFSTYQRMWAVMESARPSVFVSSNEEGMERVSKSKRLYAFLMESTPLEFITERQCDLTKVGSNLDSKGYGIAMPRDSPYRTAISGAVLKMQEEGKLHVLKTRWWKEKLGGGMCKNEEAAASDSAAELGIQNVGGVFVVLGFGCLVALLMGTLEFLWNVQKVAVEERVTPWEALKAELYFALNIFITSKPVHNTLSESESSKSSSKSSKSREASESRSTTANVLHAASSILHMDKIGNFFNKNN